VHFPSVHKYVQRVFPVKKLSSQTHKRDFVSPNVGRYYFLHNSVNLAKEENVELSRNRFSDLTAPYLSSRIAKTLEE
jgi:hypothetical protein